MVATLYDAIELAIIAHDGQYRSGNVKLCIDGSVATNEIEIKKGGRIICSRIPYVTHPFVVMESVGEYSERYRDVQMIAILHDVIEDTSVTYDMIKRQFGEHVADAVQELTCVDGDKIKAIDQIVSEDAMLVKMADRIHNCNGRDSHSIKYRQKEKIIHSTVKMLNKAITMGLDDTSIFMTLEKMAKELGYIHDIGHETELTYAIENDSAVDSDVVDSEAVV